MIAAAALFAASALMYATRPLVAWWDRRQAELDRMLADAFEWPEVDLTEQKRLDDVRWFAIQAATDTPIFADLAAEQMRAELEAPDAVDRIAGGRA